MPLFPCPTWIPGLTAFEAVVLVVYLAALVGYRFFLSLMLRHRPHHLFLGKLQEYRLAWIETHSHDANNIVVVQTLRNTIMSTSFLASTAVILIMGALNLVWNGGSGELAPAATATTGLPVAHLRVLLVVIVLSYSFFNFTWALRETNYMSFILNIPKERLDAIEDGDSTAHIAQMFLTAGKYFSLGMRGYYFLIPLLLWFFSPLLMLVATALIVFILLRRDLKG